jgi:hypothetical protein
VKLRMGFEGGAYVRFDDEAKKGVIPTPEVIEDILRRMERSATHMNASDADALTRQADPD